MAYEGAASLSLTDTDFHDTLIGNEKGLTMIKAYTIESLKKALAKAKAKVQKVHPTIEIMEFGEYRVSKSKGDGYYTVRAGRTEAQEFFIACECRGSLEGLACYHAAKVFEMHTAFAKLVKATKAKDISLPSEGRIHG